MDELDTFYELLSKCGSKPAILSIISPKAIKGRLPMI